MLQRKLWRDIKGNYGAYLACVSVLVIGLTLYTALSLTVQSVSSSVEQYYHQYKFADGFAQVVRAPYSVIDDLQEINGIEAVAGRLVQDFLLSKPAGGETTTLRLISFTNNQPVNRFMLSQGHLPTVGAKELLVSPAFFEANHYHLGDPLALIIEGREVIFKITGTAYSPEYMYEVPNGQTSVPNPTAFGIAYVPYPTLAAVMKQEGQLNDFVFKLGNGVKYADIKVALIKNLDAYGLKAHFAREDQLSNNILYQKINGLKVSATTAPIIFLLVAATIMYIMLRRMVEQQRGLIGLLKAFGYSSLQIVTHYLGYAWLLGLVGGLGGGLVGTWLSFYLLELYRYYFNIPNLAGSISLSYLVAGTLLTLVFSSIAGFQGCKSILSLAPADAMRPTAPKAGSKTPVEKITVLWQLLNTQAKMAVRNIFRSRQRSLFAVGGIACAFSLMVATMAMIDASQYFVTFQYDQVELYDLKIGLKNYVDKTEVTTASKYLTGVQKVEPILEVPVTISHRWLEKDIAVLGLTPQANLYRLLNLKGELVRPPTSGLIISSHLAELLAVQPGDRVTLRLLGGTKKEYQVQVRNIIPQYVGLGAYMDLDSLSKLVQSPPIASSLLLKINSTHIAELRKELQKGQNVLTVQDKNQIAAQFKELMATTGTTQYILLIFAFITGFAIIYNINIIALSERERELATLMVLGMTEQEVGRILVIEQAALGLVGVLCGFPLGYGMLSLIIEGTKSDIYNMPLILAPKSLLIAFLGTVFFLIAAQWKIKGKISNLSMLDVLKEQGD